MTIASAVSSSKALRLHVPLSGTMLDSLNGMLRWGARIVEGSMRRHTMDATKKKLLTLFDRAIVGVLFFLVILLLGIQVAKPGGIFQ